MVLKILPVGLILRVGRTENLLTVDSKPDAIIAVREFDLRRLGTDEVRDGLAAEDRRCSGVIVNESGLSSG
jgi:hypothetical protein